MRWKFEESFLSDQLSSRAVLHDDSRVRTTCYVRYVPIPPKLKMHRIGQSHLLILSLLVLYLPGCDASTSSAAGFVIVSVYHTIFILVKYNISLILGR